MQILQIPAHVNNFSRGRGGLDPVAIVNHIMIGTLAGTNSWFRNGSAGVSSHYGVGADGTVVQYVQEADTAYTNGSIRAPNSSVATWVAMCQQRGINPNRVSITIEWEGFHRGGRSGIRWHNMVPYRVDFMPGTITSFWVPTPAQLDAGIQLIREIHARHARTIPFARAGIGRHSDVDNVKKWFCPGSGFPLATILNRLGVPGY